MPANILSIPLSSSFFHVNLFDIHHSVTYLLTLLHSCHCHMTAFVPVDFHIPEYIFYHLCNFQMPGSIYPSMNLHIFYPYLILYTPFLTEARNCFFSFKFEISMLTATASTCNVVLMRNSELVEGIEVFDRNQKVVGTSKVAAKKVWIIVLYVYI